jgi:AcrR family transcriptional regulator
MKPQRLTREQSKDQTRERLFEAAHAIFTEKGYVAATVEDITAAAGFTRGAFYSNFGSKGELLLELLQRDHEAMQAELQRIFDSGGTREQMETGALIYYSQYMRSHASFLLWVEAKLLASRDAEFRTLFDAYATEKCAQMAQLIAQFADKLGLKLLLPAEVLALGLMSLCDGVQSNHMASPQFVTDEMVEAVLAGFFARVVLGRAPDGASVQV